MMYPQFSSRNMMSHHASACQAEASFSCAHPACYACDNTITLILDAIILASIIIFGLVRLVSLGLNVALVGLILLAVLLVLALVCTPVMRKRL